LQTPRQLETRVAGSRTWTGFLCAVAVFAILCATLFPFNPHPQNKVSWLPQAGGLRFRWGGVVVSQRPLQLPDPGDNTCTVELLIRPATIRFSSTILAFYVTGHRHPFEVSQWTDGLLLTHNPSIEHDPTHTIKIDVDHVFRAGKLVQITISSGAGGTNVYVDGQPAGHFPRFRISRGDIAGEIILGTSLVTDVWPGELHGLAVYAKELTPAQALKHYMDWMDSSNLPDSEDVVSRYSFIEGAGSEVRNQVASEPDLQIPKFFYVPHKPFLQTPVQEFELNWEYVGDVAQNIAGFVPLGLVVCSFFAWRNSRWQSVVYTTIACGALSFVIEVSQYFIPQRGSGMTDIITNTLGAALGAILAETRLIRGILEGLRVMPRTPVSLEEAGMRR